MRCMCFEFLHVATVYTRIYTSFEEGWGFVYDEKEDQIELVFVFLINHNW